MGASGSKGAPPPPPSPRAASSGSSTAREPTSRLETGVTLAFLRDLPDLFEVRSGAMPQSLTTEQLVFGKSRRNATRPSPLKRCLLQATKKRNWCFVEECEHQGFTHSRHGDPYFLPATHYVVHSWHRNWGQLTEALERFTETRRLNPRDTSFFIDVFSANQNVPPHRELLPDALAFPSIPEDGPEDGPDPSSSSATDDDLTAEKFFKTTVDAATKTSLARCNYRVVVAPSSWSSRRRIDGCGVLRTRAGVRAARDRLGRRIGPELANLGREAERIGAARFRSALVRSGEADLVRSFTATQDVAFEWIGGIDASTASAADKLDETLLRVRREEVSGRVPVTRRRREGRGHRGAGVGVRAQPPRGDRRGGCRRGGDMRAALGRLHAYRRRDGDASAQSRRRRPRRAAAATGGPNAPAADASARAVPHEPRGLAQAGGGRDEGRGRAGRARRGGVPTAFSIPTRTPSRVSRWRKLTTLQEMQRLERVEDRDEDALTECGSLGRAYFRHGRMQECSAVMASAVMVLGKSTGAITPPRWRLATRDPVTRAGAHRGLGRGGDGAGGGETGREAGGRERVVCLTRASTTSVVSCGD